MKLALANACITTAFLLSHSTASVDANRFSSVSGRNAWSLGLGRNVNGIAGLIKRKNGRPKPSDYPRNTFLPQLELNDEVCDCFENDISSPDAIYATIESIVQKDSSPSNSMKSSVQKMIRGCYSVCPGEAYSRSSSDGQGQVLFSSLRTRKERVQNAKPKKKKLPSPATKTKEATSPRIDEESEALTEPSSATLSGIVKPLIPTNIWNSLTGKEFFFPSVLSALAKTGIQTVLPSSSEFIEWKPADTKTKKLLALNDDKVVRRALADEGILVWIGKFKKEGHGSHLPLIKTTSILPLAPRDMASLLMDSEKVQSYNKMSLGRADEVIFQEGIDNDADDAPMGIGGEAKIVRNLTKPPLSKKLMEFVTVMYARRLKADDKVGIGIMGGSYEDGYAVVSRAVSGGQWGSGNQDGEESERTRSEILLGMNLIRTVPGEAGKCEVTAVTHCNSPSIPKMLAGSVGVKGAVDFVRDIRAMFN